MKVGHAHMVSATGRKNELTHLDIKYIIIIVIIIIIIIMTIYNKEKCSKFFAKTQREKGTASHKKRDQTKMWKNFKKGGYDDSIIAMI